MEKKKANWEEKKKERKNNKLNKAEECNYKKEKYKAKNMIEMDFISNWIPRIYQYL